jgi:hypothetical protein
VINLVNTVYFDSSGLVGLKNINSMSGTFGCGQLACLQYVSIMIALKARDIHNNVRCSC